MSNPQFAPTPLHGAAYRVLIERTTESIRCMQTDADCRAIERDVDDVLVWAGKHHDKLLWPAYAWGAKLVKQAARERLAIVENARKVLRAYEDIPKPS